MDDRKQIRIFMGVIGTLGLIMLFAAIYLLPQLIDFSINTYPEIAYLARPVGIIVVVSAIPFFVVLIQTFMLSKYILSDAIYTDKPLKALSIISVASIIICFLFLIVLILFLANDYFTPLLAIILFLVIISSFIIGMFSKILHILVKKATILKIDSDLTIWGILYDNY